VLSRRTEAALADGATAAGQRAGLPPVDHPWYGDDERGPWWLDHLFAHWQLPGVPEWLDQQLQGRHAADIVHRHAWLRTLVQRAAWERRPGGAADVLRQLYADTKLSGALQAADAAFAAAFPLPPFGGPWNERLGLQPCPARVPPFAVGKAKKTKGKTKSAPAAADVTVLIPSFRHAEFVTATLHSVLAQRHPDFKVLVVDDCSPDDTVARARAVADPRVEVRVNPENLGLGNSVLRALATIDTPFVALLNSDDLFHPDRLAKCRDVLLAKPDVQLVTTGVALVDRDGGELTPANTSLVLDGQQVFDWVHWYAGASPPTDLVHDELFGALLEHNFLATSSNLVCRTDWLRAQAGSLQSLKYCLDWQLFLQAALEDGLHHIHEPLVAYRLHATNTVWFRDGARWAYWLEVNRVAAAAVRAFARRGNMTNGAIARVLAAIAHHLAVNSETDGLGLFVNAVFDAVELDRLAGSSPQVRELVQQLAARAQALHSGRDRATNPAAEDGVAFQLLRGELAAEQATIEADTRRWLQGYCAELDTRLRDCWSGRDRIEQDKAELVRRQVELDRMIADLEARVRRQADLERDLAALRADLAIARGAAAALQDLRDQLSREIGALHDEHALVHAEREQLRHEHHTLLAATRDLEQHRQQLEHGLAEHRDARQRLQTELDATHQSWATTRVDKQKAERRRDELDADLARQTAQVRQLRAAKEGLDGRCNELVHELARSREEMAKLVRSREFRTGNFLWNKLPLAYLSRRGKKWYRRLVDAKNRALMVLRRPRRADGVAVVAACWQWPIYSHTFVYQEMIALTHMGLAVQMFHWDLGDVAQLHKAFGYLADHRTQLQPIWENHARDQQHFATTRPGKLRAFLERVAQATGKPVAELDKEPLVVQGCTFARMAELAGARYLHSYFFYDQSFMAMQAAWLLDLPRGVSCYADHMLDDYPFKLVPLHVELASVVVATSARIKKELSAKTGGRFDDKIIVKPNGVDGARFPPRSRPDRAAGEPFEVISISRIEPKKGLTHLAEAVAELKQRGLRVVAHVVGSKDPHSKGSLEYAAEFERKLVELGVQDDVILHGMKRQEELPPLLQRCRAFVAPYVELGSGDKDGIPTAMLEGMASAMAVVTTDSGSILEVVSDGVEGLVVPQRDSHAFADALARLIEDPALERRLAKAARARFDREFDIRVTEQRLHERVAAAIARAGKKP
ncbi:MAG: glycosyltransferase, partial [Planctomycetota bacterium]